MHCIQSHNTHTQHQQNSLTTHTQTAWVSSTNRQDQRNHCDQFIYADIATQNYLKETDY